MRPAITFLNIQLSNSRILCLTVKNLQDMSKSLSEKVNSARKLKFHTED